MVTIDLRRLNAVTDASIDLRREVFRIVADMCDGADYFFNDRATVLSDLRGALVGSVSEVDAWPLVLEISERE